MALWHFSSPMKLLWKCLLLSPFRDVIWISRISGKCEIGASSAPPPLLPQLIFHPCSRGSFWPLHPRGQLVSWFQVVAKGSPHTQRGQAVGPPVSSQDNPLQAARSASFPAVLALSLLRWCTISELELAKCSAMSKAFAGAGLLPSLACVKGGSTSNCILMINVSPKHSLGLGEGGRAGLN